MTLSFEKDRLSTLCYKGMSRSKESIMEHTHQGFHADPPHTHGAPESGSPHQEHDQPAGHSVAMFRDKFWLTLAFTVPVVVWSADVQHWLHYTAPSFLGSNLIPALFGTLVFVYGGLVFLRGALRELADREPGMMTLLRLAILVAFVASLARTF